MAGTDHLYEFLRWLSTEQGFVVGGDLFANVMPETTGIVASVVEMRSPPPYLLHSTSYIRRPRFRIDVRSTAPSAAQSDYPDITDARNIAQSLYQSCLDLAGRTLLPSSDSTEGGNWLFAIPESEPYLDGRDEKNRVVFTFDVQCERQAGSMPSTAASLAAAWLSGDTIDWLVGGSLDWLSTEVV